MKQTSAKFLLFSILAALLYSCSTNNSIGITKRHYRNGYFIENPVFVSSKKEKPSPASTAKITVATDNSTETREKSPTAENLTPYANPEISTDLSDSKAVPVLTEGRHKSISAAKNVLPEIPFYKTISAKRTRSFLKMPDEGDHHFSLGGFLWFIIVLLLILFLLNFLLSFNLGGLVYLILLIAVILLLFRLIGML
jgi:hypothetical protein